MANGVLIIGESGTGKSTSIRSLNPKETFIINVLDKPLPFKGFRKSYSQWNRENLNGNYCATDDYLAIEKVIQYINKNMPHIKNLIIDDWQYTMGNEFMRKADEKGFDKFTKIGMHGWKIIDDALKCRPELNVFVLSHSDIDANGRSKPKTIGKMIDEKITLEGMFTTVLHTVVENGSYRFLTQNDGSRMAKSPMDMFEDKFIDNDLGFVAEKMKEYLEEDVFMNIGKEAA